ncbi:carboxypeptidase-like regulatory domain-containing protein [Tunturiibacter gelidiferens]|uniref:carboxypeptidase-like regulatory domain-containing protein n=1 Tax=Tunturiibacter gelidiferens TaxID=3069689 RepID=UPI00333FEA4A
MLLTIWVVGLALSLPAQSSSQRKQANDELTLFGQVVDALGNPVDQASVKLKLRDGTQMSAATDQSGSFTFKNPSARSQPCSRMPRGLHKPGSDNWRGISLPLRLADDLPN